MTGIFDPSLFDQKIFDTGAPTPAPVSKFFGGGGDTRDRHTRKVVSPRESPFYLGYTESLKFQLVATYKKTAEKSIPLTASREAETSQDLYLTIASLIADRAKISLPVWHPITNQQPFQTIATAIIAGRTGLDLSAQQLASNHQLIYAKVSKKTTHSKKPPLQAIQTYSSFTTIDLTAFRASITETELLAQVFRADGMYASFDLHAWRKSIENCELLTQVLKKSYLGNLLELDSIRSQIFPAPLNLSSLQNILNKANISGDVLQSVLFKQMQPDLTAHRLKRASNPIYPRTERTALSSTALAPKPSIKKLLALSELDDDMFLYSLAKLRAS